MSQAYTRQEVKEMFLDHLDMMVDEWTKNGIKNGSSRHENLTSMVFSILALIDGVSAGFPAIDLLLDPHEDNKDYCQKNDENWFEPDMSIPGGDHLHDEWYSEARKARRVEMERMILSDHQKKTAMAKYDIAKRLTGVMWQEIRDKFSVTDIVGDVMDEARKYGAVPHQIIAPSAMMSTPFPTRVRTASELHGRDFTVEAMQTRRPNATGTVVGYHNSHGLCFVVKHDDGGTSAYDPEELTLIDPETR